MDEINSGPDTAGIAESYFPATLMDNKERVTSEFRGF